MSEKSFIIRSMSKKQATCEISISLPTGNQTTSLNIRLSAATYRGSDDHVIAHASDRGSDLGSNLG